MLPIQTRRPIQTTGHTDIVETPRAPKWRSILSLHNEASWGFVLGLSVFLALLAFQWDHLRQPPTWDAAMGMYPAAIELNRNGFDLPALLAQPGFTEGGPNVHATSLGTWFVALTMAVFGNLQDAIPFLHLVNYALAGAVAAGVYRITKRWANTPTAILVGIAAVLYPPLLAQATDIYIDLPVGTAILWAVVFTFEGRHNRALLLGTAGILIKAIAIIVIPIILLSAVHAKRRALMATSLLVTASAVLIANLGNSTMSKSFHLSLEELTVNARFSRSLLGTNPDFWIVGLLVLAAAVVVDRRTLGTETQRESATAGARLFVLYVAFIFFSPVFSTGVRALPRYSVAISSLLVAAASAGTAAVAHPSTRRNLYMPITATVFILIFSANAQGSLYSGSENTSVLAQRSLDYQSLVAIQQRSLQRLAEVAQRMPVYVDHYTHYRLSYPEMGWVPGALVPAVRMTQFPSDSFPDLAQMPSEFGMLIQESWAGGDLLTLLWRQSLEDPARVVTTRQYHASEYYIHLVVVDRAP